MLARNPFGSWAGLPLIALIALAQSADSRLKAQTQRMEPVQFENYEGTFVRSGSSSVEIATADGNKTFRVIKNPKDSPFPDGGQVTSISVSGVDRVSFLKTRMAIEFEAEQDKTKTSRVPIEAITVLSLKSKTPTSRELLSEIDAKTGNSLYRFTALVEGFDPTKNELAVTVRSEGKSERSLFTVDPEKTQVSYDLPDLKLAQPGDNVSVRVLPFSTSELIALEVRVFRPSEFAADDESQPPDAESGNADDSTAAKRDAAPFKSLLDSDEPAGADAVSDDQAIAEDDAENTSEDNEQAEDREAADVITFDFALDPQKPAEGEKEANGNEAMEGAAAPKPFADFLQRKTVTPRRWFKIN